MKPYCKVLPALNLTLLTNVFAADLRWSN